MTYYGIRYSCAGCGKFEEVWSDIDGETPRKYDNRPVGWTWVRCWDREHRPNHTVNILACNDCQPSVNAWLVDRDRYQKESQTLGRALKNMLPAWFLSFAKIKLLEPVARCWPKAADRL